MKKNKLLFIAFFTCTALFAQSQKTDDSIFSYQKPVAGDFVIIKNEPNPAKIKADIFSQIDSYKQKSQQNIKSIQQSAQELVKEQEKKARTAAGQTYIEKKTEKPSYSQSAPEKKATQTPSEAQKKPDPAATVVNKAKDLRKKFIEYSFTLKGIKYKWGGSSPSDGGLDCSGFVKYSAKNGIDYTLSRTAQAMYNDSEIIQKSQIQPGDLVFFKPRTSSKVSHVGIYLGKDSSGSDFNGREIFINAVSDGPRTGVIISALDENYWKKTYYAAGRFLPSM